MKKFILLIVVFAFFSLNSCVENNKNIDIKKEKKDIEAVLEQYNIANETHNFKLIENIWARDKGIVCIGTDTDEKLVGWEQIKKAFKNQFESLKDTYISVSDQIININKTVNTAWFSEILNYNFIYKGKPQSYNGIRYTGVLEKRDNKWVLVQTHMSIPVKSTVENVQN